MVTCQIKSYENNSYRAANCLISIDGACIWNTALKKQDNGDSLVLRLYNTKETENRAVLHISDCIKSVTEANMLEAEFGAEIENAPCGVTLDFAPKEIKTLLLKV